MKEGWVSIHRKLENHWIWVRPDYLRAWIWLLLHANHKPKTIFTSAAPVEVKRGEVVSSLSHLSSAFGWGIKRTRTFLRWLEKDGLIVIETSSKWTKITICKYDKYQYAGHHKGTPKAKNKTHIGQAKDNQGATNNNGNNENHDNKGDKTRFTPPTLDEVVEYFSTLELKPGATAKVEAEIFHNYYKSKGWVVGDRAKMKDWRGSAQNWVKRDFSKKINTKSNFINKESDYN